MVILHQEQQGSFLQVSLCRMNTQLLNTTLAMPDVALFVTRLQHALTEERQKRLRFYEAVDENTKMEFINGEVVFHSPVMKRHNTATGRLYKLADTFAIITQQGFVGIEKILISLTRNDYEPDICYFRADKAAQFTPKQMQFPAPDWVIEVLSDSTAANDRGVKFRDYAAHGIEEYWIIDPDNETIEQYRLVAEGAEKDAEKDYELLLKAKEGTIRSLTLEGFVIPIRAVFDEAENVQALAALVSTPR
jgi:Uma2 family endonuclease